MFDLTGKIVEVEAHGIIYRGKLVEVNETEVHLETENGWVVVMNNEITGLRAVEDGRF